MSVEKPTNLAASARAKLKNLADREGVAFQNVLTRYGIERFLYRLSRSVHADNFILKGATLFVAWEGHPHRATRDLDLLGFGANGVEDLVTVFKTIVATQVEPDGLAFNPDLVRGESIMEGQRYRGVRLHLMAMLGNARVPVQVDVGFGDPVEPTVADFPTLIGMPAPRLRLYPRDAVVAEKLHAMVVRGLLNGRMKDFYDIWYLARTTVFSGVRLRHAIERTFTARATPLPLSIPDAWTPAFADVPGKPQMWAGFVRKAALPDTTPPLEQVVVVVAEFGWPVLRSDAAIQDSQDWRPERGWSPAPPG